MVLKLEGSAYIFTVLQLKSTCNTDVSLKISLNFFFLHYTIFLYFHSSSVFNVLLRGCYFSKLLTKPTFLGKFYHWNYESDFVFLHNLYSSIYHCYQGLDLHWGDSLQNTSIFPLFAAAHSVHTKSLLQLSPLVYSQIDKVKLAAWIFFSLFEFFRVV